MLIKLHAPRKSGSKILSLQWRVNFVIIITATLKTRSHIYAHANSHPRLACQIEWERETAKVKYGRRHSSLTKLCIRECFFLPAGRIPQLCANENGAAAVSMQSARALAKQQQIAFRHSLFWTTLSSTPWRIFACFGLPGANLLSEKP